MTPTLSQILERAKFDENTPFDFKAVDTALENFLNGVEWDNARLYPIIEKLVAVVRMQDEALQKVQGGYSVFEQVDYDRNTGEALGEIRKKEYPETVSARNTRAAAERMLKEVCGE